MRVNACKVVSCISHREENIEGDKFQGRKSRAEQLGFSSGAAAGISNAATGRLIRLPNGSMLRTLLRPWQALYSVDFFKYSAASKVNKVSEGFASGAVVLH